MLKSLPKVGVIAGLLIITLTATSTPALAGKTVLKMRVNGPMLESASDSAGLMAILAEEDMTTLHGWLGTVQKAGADSRIDGLVLIIEQPVMGFAQVEEMRRALQDFRDQGKPIYCYLDYADNLTYALASAADHVTLAENSDLAIIGLYAELWYYKGMLEKLGIETQMKHRGDYKSAHEPFTRKTPSEEAAANINWLLDGLYEHWLKMIAESRGLSVKEVTSLVDQAPLSAVAAHKARLVDDVSSFSTFKQLIHKEFGSDVRVLDKYRPRDEMDVSFDSLMQEVMTMIMSGGRGMMDDPMQAPPGVGLIYVDGMIVVGPNDEGPFGGGVAGSTTIRAAFEHARSDDAIKAVVLRVDSPGGSALASDIIWKAATDLANEKPLIVSMGNVAGSGGYYVALPGDTIFAESTTITGSIGVVGGKFVWKGLLEEKLGITTAEFKRGRHAGLVSMHRKWNETEEAWIEKYLTTTYEQFKQRVMSSRGQKLKKDFDELAGGRVFTGQQALELGLVDRIGGLDAALDLAAREAGLGDDYAVHHVPPASDIAEFVRFFSQIMQTEKWDDYPIERDAEAAALGDPLLRAGLPLLQELAPAQARDMLRTLGNLIILRDEHVGCFMTTVPHIR